MPQSNEQDPQKTDDNLDKNSKDPSGAPENNKDNGDDVVKYETYQRVLSQHKKSKQRADELEAKLKELSEFKQKAEKLEEQKLKEDGNWKQLLEQREAKLNELNEQLSSLKEQNEGYQRDIDDMIKINAFTNAIGGKLRKTDYYRFVDTSKIALNPETKTVDEESLKQYANEFTNSFKELISFDGPKLPQGAPNGSGKLSFEEWKRLPLKEKKARQADVKLD